MLTRLPELDREALAARNISLAQAFHQMPFKHRVRRSALQWAARLPVPMGRRIGRERILLIRPDHLGDVLLMTPVIHALREALPYAAIHALVGPWSADVLAAYPELDAVITLPFPGFTRSAKRGLRSPYELAWRSARQLRKVRYSSAVILRPDHWWGALMAYLAGIPERIGYAVPDVAPFLSDGLVHERQHNVVQNLRLVEKWTGKLAQDDIAYQFVTTDLDRAYVDGYLLEWRIQAEDPIFAIHPGAGTWVKRWDEAHWAAVADTLVDQLDARVVFTGSDHELPIVRAIVEKMERPACVMVGDTQVTQLAALFARAKVVLGPDSGPLHLAAAVHTPTVALFGPADPLEFAPWGPKERHIVLTTDIACRPCHVLDWGGDDPALHPCVREITVGRVLEAARRVVQHR